MYMYGVLTWWKFAWGSNPQLMKEAFARAVHHLLEHALVI